MCGTARKGFLKIQREGSESIGCAEDNDDREHFEHGRNIAVRCGWLRAFGTSRDERVSGVSACARVAGPANVSVNSASRPVQIGPPIGHICLWYLALGKTA